MTNFLIHQHSKETVQTGAQRKKIIIDKHSKPLGADQEQAESDLKSCLNDSQELGKTSLLDSILNQQPSQENRTMESPRPTMGPIGLGSEDINVSVKKADGPGLVG